MKPVAEAGAAAAALGTMLGARLYGAEDLRLERLAIPSPGEREVLVRVGACGICGSDLHLFRGADPWAAGFAGPRPLGHETAGVVSAAGPRAGRFRPGDRVAIEPPFSIGCGSCPSCHEGRTNLCSEPNRWSGGLPGVGGFAEFLSVPEEQVHPVASHVDLEAAALADAYACALHALERARVEGLEAVGVVGTGALAVAVGQVAPTLGVRRVLIVGRRPESTERAAAACGAGLGLTRRDGEDLELACSRLLGEGAPRVVVEAAGGSGASMAAALEAVAPGGTVCVLGAFWPSLELPYAVAVRKEVEIVFSNAYLHHGRRPDFARALDLIARGAVHPGKLISHRFPLERIVPAFETAASGAGIRVLVSP
jgi:2-desacetyl-2-hydroxyethyl bacteriochlorophyllide A dehydrogenase